MFHRLLACCLTLCIAAATSGVARAGTAASHPQNGQPQNGQPQSGQPQNGESGDAAAPVVEDTTFIHDFGLPGQPGSLRVMFDTQAAGIWKVWLLDHYTTALAAKKAQKDFEDYFAFAYDVQPGSLSMVLEPDEASGYQYPVPLGVAKREDGTFQKWEHTVTNDTVTFRLASGDGLTFEKVFRHRPERREIVLTLRMTASREFEPIRDQLFVTLRGLMLGPEKSKVETSFNSNLEVFLGQVHDGVERLDPVAKRASDLTWPRQRILAVDGGQHIVFGGTTSRFFANFVYADDEASRSRFVSADASCLPSSGRMVGTTAIPALSVPRGYYGLRLDVPSNGGSSETSLALYMGPKSADVFDQNEAFHEPFQAIMDVDLEPMCCGIPLVRPLAKGLLWLLRRFESFVGSWGIAVMMLTLLVRGTLVPLNFRMQKSMRAYSAKMGILKPKLDALQKKHADDKAALQKAMMEFQREHKIMPPLGGCLPIFLTMPVYIGLFTCLRVAYDLRHQGFLFVDDLSQPDALFGIAWNFQPVFNILPLIWISLFWWLTKSQPLPDDPQQRQVAKMMRLMPLIFGVMLYNYPSALMVYMITSAVFGMLESKIIKKILGPMPTSGGIQPMPVM